MGKRERLYDPVREALAPHLHPAYDRLMRALVLCAIDVIREQERRSAEDGQKEANAA